MSEKVDCINCRWFQECDDPKAQSYNLCDCEKYEQFVFGRDDVEE